MKFACIISNCCTFIHNILAFTEILVNANNFSTRGDSPVKFLQVFVCDTSLNFYSGTGFCSRVCSNIGMLEDMLFDTGAFEDEDIPRRRRRKIFKPRINFSFPSDFEFKERFRMPASKVEWVVQELGALLAHPTKNSGALSINQQVSIALHWLGSAAQYHVVGDMHGVHKSTVCRAVKRFVAAVCIRLFPRVVTWPQDIEREVANFYSIAGFPRVIGAVDGSLINIDAPTRHEAAFVDRHGNHSLNCMFVSGSRCQFLYVNPKWPGSVHDSRVLRNSRLYEQMEQGMFPNYVILGDSAYGLRTWLMPPLRNDPRDEAERVYNIRHKSTRRIVECALGILKEKFPCLNRLRVGALTLHLMNLAFPNVGHLLLIGLEHHGGHNH